MVVITKNLLSPLDLSRLVLEMAILRLLNTPRRKIYCRHNTLFKCWCGFPAVPQDRVKSQTVPGKAEVWRESIVMDFPGSVCAQVEVPFLSPWSQPGVFGGLHTLFAYPSSAVVMRAEIRIQSALEPCAYPHSSSGQNTRGGGSWLIQPMSQAL